MGNFKYAMVDRLVPHYKINQIKFIFPRVVSQFYKDVSKGKPTFLTPKIILKMQEQN